MKRLMMGTMEEVVEEAWRMHEAKEGGTLATQLVDEISGTFALLSLEAGDEYCGWYEVDGARSKEHLYQQTYRQAIFVKYMQMDTTYEEVRIDDD